MRSWLPLLVPLVLLGCDEEPATDPGGSGTSGAETPPDTRMEDGYDPIRSTSVTEGAQTS